MVCNFQQTCKKAVRNCNRLSLPYYLEAYNDDILRILTCQNAAFLKTLKFAPGICSKCLPFSLYLTSARMALAEVVTHRDKIEANL
jgi:hypothetical protein